MDLYFHTSCMPSSCEQGKLYLVLPFIPDQITNKELWNRMKQTRIDLPIRKRKWGWLGHTLWKPPVIARQALEWNPQGRRGRGRPRNTWRRTVLEEAKGFNETAVEIKTDTKNTVRWRIHVEVLCFAAEWWDAIHIYIYRVSQEECARLWENVP